MLRGNWTLTSSAKWPAQKNDQKAPELKWDDRVATIASAHSADMDSRNFFSHINPDGKGPFQRLQGSNVAFSAVAENIALGPKTGQEAYDTWLRSPGHRRNILDVSLDTVWGEWGDLDRCAG